MIPLTKCPGCQGRLKRINHNASWFEEICKKRCPLDYAQFHKTSFDDNEIGYFVFYTTDFMVYVYINHFNVKDTTHIYHRIFPKGENVQKPVFILDRFEIEWDKLDYYNNKWKIWNTFS